MNARTMCDDRRDVVISEKVFSFDYKINSTSEALTVKIYEVLDADYGLYVWPCAPVLAKYVAERADFIKDKNILEIGCGTALVGIVAAKLGGKVTLSDCSKFPLNLINVEKSLAANSLAGIRLLNIDWGILDSSVLDLGPVDIILGSDCFYDTKDFEPVLVTASYLLKENPDSEFWTSYQVRSSDRSIEHLLIKWNLDCRTVSLESQSCHGNDIMLFVMTYKRNGKTQI